MFKDLRMLLASVWVNNEDEGKDEYNDDDNDDNDYIL